jgi:cytidyltransferase-like protein
MRTLFTNGAFDIIHPGHIRLLNFAKSLSDYVWVGLDTDSRYITRKQKSPIFNWDEREEILSGLGVCCVPINSDEDLFRHILRYDIYLKGYETSDSKFQKELDAHARSEDKIVIRFPTENKAVFSSSAIKERIRLNSK